MTHLAIDVNALLDDLCQQIKTKAIFSQAPKMIGIRTGGEWIAQQLHQQLQIEAPLGVIDIAFYRDDFSKIGLNPTVQPSNIPWEIDGQHIILVDDVLYTGRTIRAALNEIFDYGRPASVTLVVLIDRKGCRELPFQPDVVGQIIHCHQTVKLSGPDPLCITLVEQPCLDGGILTQSELDQHKESA